MYPGAYVHETPDKPAVIMAATGETVSFADLETNSIRLAHHFRSRGLGRGDHIAVLATNKAQVFDIYWAAIRSGLYITMINWHLTLPEMAYLIDDCQARAVIIDADLHAIASDLIPKCPQAKDWMSFGGAIAGIDTLDSAALDHPTHAPNDEPRGADMLYSSGTTGRPKGIKPTLPDRQIGDPGDSLIELNRTVWGVGPDDIYLSPAPLYHAAPLRTCATVQALGGTVVVMDRFDAEKALSYIEQFRITYSQWVPTMFVRMLKLPESTRNRYDLSSMRVAVHAAAPCPVEIKRQMIDWWGPIVDEYYSSTELNGMTLVKAPDWLRKPGTVGRAAIGTLRICGNDGTVLPTNEVGTVYFERDTLPFEYHNDPDKTRQAQHPKHPTWTTTGDVGYVDDAGYLFLVDRKSFMIISGGVNIYPQEIENILVEHPKVLDAAVIGIPDNEMGESVLAIVEPSATATGNDALAAELLDYLQPRLARFKHPRRIVFSNGLPRTPTGKLAKVGLRERYSDSSSSLTAL